MSTVDETPAVPQDLQDAYPLTSLQAGMFFHSEYQEQTATYHDVQTLVLRGALDEDHLRGILDELTERHAVLRTSFSLDGFSEPLQLVHAAAAIPLEVHDWSALPAGPARERLASWREEEKFTDFDLTRPPLLRVIAHRLPDGLFALSLSFHHAILDGWSLGTLVGELLRRYLARLDGRPLPTEPPTEAFRDFVEGERAATASAEAAAFWTGVIDGAPLAPLPRLPGYPRQGQALNETLSAEIPAHVLNRLARTADEHGVPLRTVLLAAHLRVVALLTGETDATTGIVAHGRAQSEGGTEVLGLFLNSLPLRLRVDDHASWTELIQAVHRAEKEILPQRRFPHFEIQRLAGPSRLFDTLFDYRDLHVYQELPSDPRLAVVAREHAEHIDIPLSVGFIRSQLDGTLGLQLKYDQREFPPEQIALARDHYLTALGELAAGAERDPRPTTPYLAGATGAELTEPGGTGGARTLLDLFARSAARVPEQTAVVDGGTRIAYAELERAVDARTAGLQEAGVGPGMLVGIHLPRSVEQIAVLLAVLRCGATVLPLEVEYPARRIAASLADNAPDLVLTAGDVAERLPYDGRVLLVTDLAQPAGPATPRPVPVGPADPAYVICTSGSTGHPKSIVLSHGALTDFATWYAAFLGLDGSDVVAQRTGVGFDAAIMETFTAFGCGARLVVVPTEAVGDGDRFAEIFTQEGITFTFLVPSILAHHTDMRTFARCPSLRTVAVGGEAVQRTLVESFLAQSDARLFAVYGPTETGVVVSGRPVVAGEEGTIAPIGRPAWNMTMHVVDDQGREQPVGAPGELWIGGPQLSGGYRGLPALTADRFVPDTLTGTPGARLYRTGDLVRRLPDGELDFLGRLDRQVKLRGVRIELNEIEGALLDHPEVRHSAVTVQDTPSGERLVAYVQRTDGAAPGEDTHGITEHLRERLPESMVPGVVVALDELPLLPNGKVDRSALPEPHTGLARGYAPPRDRVEITLVSIWEEILGAEVVGVHDDFFELGGHSLLALKLTMRLRRAFGRDLPIAAVIESSTVARLAQLLRTPEHLVPQSRVIPLRGSGNRTPMFFNHGLGGQVFIYQSLARRLRDEQPVFALPAHGFADGDPLITSLDVMADAYVEHIREVRPHGPYFLGGLCIGGNMAIEVARRLRAAGEEVPLVTLFWSHAHQPVLQETLDDDTTLMMYALAGGPVKVDRDALAHLGPEERMLAVIDAAAASGSLNPSAADSAQARRILDVYRSNAYAVDAHDHAPYDGDVLLLIPEEDQGFAPGDHFGWPDIVTGKLHVAPIPGTRHTALREPLAADTAQVLQSWLDTWDGHE